MEHSGTFRIIWLSPRMRPGAHRKWVTAYSPIPAQEMGCANFSREARTSQRADVCADDGLDYASWEVGERCMDMLCGEEAKERVSEARQRAVGRRGRLVWVPGLVDGDKRGVDAYLLQNGGVCERFREADAVCECLKGGRRWGL